MWYRLPKAAAIAASSVSVSSLFPAPTRIRVTLLSSDRSMPWYWEFLLPGQFSRGPGSSEERRSRQCLRPRCPRSWSSFSSRLRGQRSSRLFGWRRSMSARLWKPTARSRARQRRERRGLGTEPAAVGSGRCWMGCSSQRLTGVPLWPWGGRGGACKG